MPVNPRCNLFSVTLDIGLHWTTIGPQYFFWTNDCDVGAGLVLQHASSHLLGDFRCSAPRVSLDEVGDEWRRNNLGLLLSPGAT